MIDLTTYALLRKQITSAASGVSDVRAEGDELIFVLADGREVRVAIPATEIRDAVVRDDVLVLTLEDDKEVVVDATLTQSGQAADAKATGDVVSQLKDDLASMNIAEEAELIEYINVEADTLTIERTLQPDGTPYKLKAVICKCFINDDVADGYILIDAFLKQTGYDQYNETNSTYTWVNVTKTDVSRAAWIIRSAINCGLLETAFYKPSTNAGSPSYVPSFANKAIIMEEGNYINRVKLIRSTGFKAGSTIIIYGVRA